MVGEVIGARGASALAAGHWCRPVSERVAGCGWAMSF